MAGEPFDAAAEPRADDERAGAPDATASPPAAALDASVPASGRSSDDAPERCRTSAPDPADRPMLRHVELSRGHHGGQSGIVLHDPLGIAPHPVFVPAALLPIVARFDGTHTVAELEAAVAAEWAAGRDGHAAAPALPRGFVASLVQDLDDRLLLHSRRFADAAAAAARTFLSAPARPARHAGSAGYPRTTPAAREALEAIAGRCAPVRPSPRGLIAPHIDLARGRDGYAHAYRWLAAREPADLYVVFGTGHHGPRTPVTGLLLDWETPLGVVRTDREFVQAVHARLGPVDPLDVLLHRDEHSLEFQMLFLAHLLAGREFRVAGFLTGSLPSATGDPGQEAWVQRLLAAFRDAAAARGLRVCWVAGADLAHVGPMFGDAALVDAARLERLRQDELRRLRSLQDGAPGAFHAAVEGCGNPDRVCSSSAMFLTAALAGGRGELLHYGQALAPDGSQAVSFCAVGFGD